MVKPDYNNCIVNVVNAISEYFDGPVYHKPIDIELDKKRVVFIILDGLGYEFLKKNKGYIFENSRKISTVFPSTTATALTSFLTGLTPQEHAVTSWFTYLKELGSIARILLFEPRAGSNPFDADIKKVLDLEPIFPDSRYIMPEKNVNSPYTKLLTGKSSGYSDLSGFFEEIRKSKEELVIGYWPLIDTLSHNHGTTDKKVIQHFREIEKGIKKMDKSDFNLVITSDHGLLDTPNILRLKDYPVLEQSMVMPFCGEPRVRFCYVRPFMTKEFESCAKRIDKCELFRSKELLHKGYYGKGKVNPKMFDRIGDYTLVMKENFIFKDLIPSEERKEYPANHGGLSKEEMHVPLFVK